MATLIWYGHGTWGLETAGQHLLVDPFLDDNPAAPVKADAVQADFLLVSHGHYDHVADAEKIAKRTGALVISNYEICTWLEKRGVRRTHGMNLGGQCQQPFGKVKLTVAHHSSVLPDGSPGGNPGGFLLTLPAGKIYFACDTALFGDMALIGRAGIDLAVLPIGDNYTMGPDDAIEAVRLLKPKRVVPSHYNTWPVIAQDAQAWAERVRRETQVEPVIVAPGQQVAL
ncbi:MAG: metal-dependent hydrolase [Planctomycetia bacterium]|nr:metal-dependent hydrolase [Planctomycetia bacterium]